MNIFEAVKQSVTTQQAAGHFGIRAGRNGMCRCPFHVVGASFIPLVPPPAAELAHSAAPPLPTKSWTLRGPHLHPSMKVDRRYFCFGCGATGDVIDFVSRLEGISPKEAALLLARAFSVPHEDKGPPGRSLPRPRQESPEQQFRRMERYCLRVLCDYRNRLGPGAVRLPQPAGPLEAGLCPQGAGGRMESFVCGSPAKAGLCGISAGHAALPRHGGTGGPDRQLWKGSEKH